MNSGFRAFPEGGWIFFFNVDSFSDKEPDLFRSKGVGGLIEVWDV